MKSTKKLLVQLHSDITLHYSHNIVLTEDHWKSDFWKHLLPPPSQFYSHMQDLPGDGRTDSPTEVKW